MKQFTRKDYIDDKCTHFDYYNQFVNYETINRVRHLSSEITNSTDPHLNDIALRKWDILSLNAFSSLGVITANNTGGFSLSDSVCIFKAAARQLKEELLNNN